jgi:lipopolysaccharide/colanic/teichoic acid biosynthesis glycosyltransferase
VSGHEDGLANGMETLFVRPMPRWKRILDVLGAVIGLVVLSPLMAAVAVGVKLTSPGPILFRQVRTGLGGEPFEILKFRTMSTSADSRKAEVLHLNEQDGPAFKIKNDPRVTKLGKFLRRSSIDELPQLWNVLRGEMTLVGPRPLPIEESAASQPWHLRRLDVAPGLTCIWQVQGRSQVTFNEWMRMDLRYVSNRTLWQDLRLLVRTVWVVIIRRGAH